MINKITKGVILVVGVVVACIALYKIYTYLFFLQEAHEYPSEVKYDMVIYSIDPETILSSIDQGENEVFKPPLKDPINDNVTQLWPPGHFAWGSEDFEKVANSLHQTVWNETLKAWKLFSANFSILQCADVNRIDEASFVFYQSRGNWYHLVHSMTIDLEYGFVYAGNDNGYYTGKWKDLDLDKAVVNTANEAVQIAEQSGGEKIRFGLIDNQECSINIFFANFVIDQQNWGWRVIYRKGISFAYGVVIDPYTGNYEILQPDR